MQLIHNNCRLCDKGRVLKTLSLPPLALVYALYQSFHVTVQLLWCAAMCRSCANPLLTKLMRETWGRPDVVQTTDCGAINNMVRPAVRPPLCPLPR